MRGRDEQSFTLVLSQQAGKVGFITSPLILLQVRQTLIERGRFGGYALLLHAPSLIDGPVHVHDILFGIGCVSLFRPIPNSLVQIVGAGLRELAFLVQLSSV